MSINKFGFRSFTEDNIDVEYKIPNMLDNYVKSNGGSMIGTLNMNNNRIMNVAKPTDSTDSATKQYVDRLDTKMRLAKEEQDKISKNLVEFQKDIKISDEYFRKEIDKLKSMDNSDMKNKQIKNVADPTDRNDVVTKGYLEKISFKPKEYKLSIPTYNDKTISGDLKLISTETNNLYILIGKLTILTDVVTKVLNIAEMKQHYTEYQIEFRCVRYVECEKSDTVSEFLNQSLVDVVIKHNNLFLITALSNTHLKKLNCLEFNTSVYLSEKT